MEQLTKEEKIGQLCGILAQIREPALIEALLEDMCTRKEIGNMAERLYAAKLLIAGNTYNQVMELAEISSATLSRVSRCVQDGKGYSKLFQNS